MLTVSVEVPEPPATELGTNAHVGGGVTDGAIALQDRLTLPLKPFIGVMVIMDVDDPPRRNRGWRERRGYHAKIL